VRFLRPEFLNLFFFLPLILLFLIWRLRSRFRIRSLWENSKLKNISKFSSKVREALIAFLIILLISLLIFVLARPQFSYRKSVKKPLDIVCLVDLSRSMNTRDVFSLGKRHSRLDLIKRELRNFVKNQIGENKNYMALVAFGANARYRSFFTFDVSSLLFQIEYLSTADFPPEGTDIGEAIITGLEMLNLIDSNPEIFKRPRNRRIFILISDGEDTVEEKLKLNQALLEIVKRRIPIYTIGAGSRKGGYVIEEIKEDGRIVYMRDEESGKKIFSRLEEKTLREIARLTGGSYVRSQSGEELAKAFRSILERGAERKIKKAYYDVYQYFLLVAFVFSLLIIILKQS